MRYAHARSRALLRNGADLGVPTGRNTGRNTRHDTDHDAVGDDATGPDTGPDDATGTYGPGARALLDSIGDHPGVLAAAARHRAPDRVARHLERTAEAFLHFQETCRPLPAGDEKPSAAHRSRLALAEAAGTVLAGGLTLLGIDAPAHL